MKRRKGISFSVNPFEFGAPISRNALIFFFLFCKSIHFFFLFFIRSFLLIKKKSWYFLIQFLFFTFRDKIGRGFYFALPNDTNSSMLYLGQLWSFIVEWNFFSSKKWAKWAKFVALKRVRLHDIFLMSWKMLSQCTTEAFVSLFTPSILVATWTVLEFL